jgi:hypothetical protein
MRSLQSLLKILAAASARVDEPPAHELLHSFAIYIQAFALPHLSIPLDSHPPEILSHRLGEIRARAMRVEIFITEPQQPSRGACTLGRDPERPCMSKME